MTAMSYVHGEPHWYDGVSEYHCPCGVCIGSWTGFVLLGGEPEFRFGGGERFWTGTLIDHVWRKGPTHRHNCDHVWRRRVRFTAGWKNVCVKCGAKAR